MPRKAADVKKELDGLQAEAVDDVRNALERLDAARAQLVESVDAALEAGVSYRKLGEATNRSREFFRGIVARNR